MIPITLLIGLLWIVVIFLISALPLYLAVKVLKGKTTLLKTAFITLISGIVVAAIQHFFRFWGGLIAFLILIWIYHEAFRLKWVKAFLAWVLQFVFLALFYFIAVALGFTLIGISFLL